MTTPTHYLMLPGGETEFVTLKPWDETEDVSPRDILMTSIEIAEGHPMQGDYIGVNDGNQYDWFLVKADQIGEYTEMTDAAIAHWSSVTPAEYPSIPPEMANRVTAGVHPDPGTLVIPSTLTPEVDMPEFESLFAQRFQAERNRVPADTARQEVPLPKVQGTAATLAAEFRAQLSGIARLTRLAELDQLIETIAQARAAERHSWQMYVIERYKPVLHTKGPTAYVNDHLGISVLKNPDHYQVNVTSTICAETYRPETWREVMAIVIERSTAVTKAALTRPEE